MGAGLLALVAVGRSDGPQQADALASKLVRMRVFEDDAGRMNRSLVDVGGTLCLVSQFTLFGDLRRGLRPSFGDAAPGDQAEPLLDALRQTAESEGVRVVTGRFGAHMDVELVGDGPVTLLLDTDRQF